MTDPRIIRPEAGLKQLQQQRMKDIENHLEQIGNFTSIRNQAMDLVLKAALETEGVPVAPIDQAALVSRCSSLAALISAERLQRYNEGVRDVCAELNVHDLPDFVVWAAKRAGVDLFKRPAQLVAEPPAPPPAETN